MSLAINENDFWVCDARCDFCGKILIECVVHHKLSESAMCFFGYRIKLARSTSVVQLSSSIQKKNMYLGHCAVLTCLSSYCKYLCLCISLFGVRCCSFVGEYQISSSLLGWHRGNVNKNILMRLLCSVMLKSALKCAAAAVHYTVSSCCCCCCWKVLGACQSVNMYMLFKHQQE